jgi:ABC-type multidrug transport system fused ATPase/permease subunit
MSSRVFRDIQTALERRDTFWMRVSMLAYVLVLPFNAYGFTIPLTAWTMKYTEVAIGALFLSTAVAWRRGQFRFLRAWWLYAALGIHVLAQLASLVNAPDRVIGVRISIAMASYAVLIILLLHVLNSEKVLRAVLVTMGAVCAVVVGVTLAQVIVLSKDFHPGQQFSVLGINTAHYLAYALIFFGVGLVYNVVRSRNKSVEQYVWGCFAVMWLYLTTLHSVKIAQIVMVTLFAFLFLFLRGSRKTVFALFFIFLALFGYRVRYVPITNAFIDAHEAASARIEDVRISGISSFPSIDISGQGLREGQRIAFAPATTFLTELTNVEPPPSVPPQPPPPSNVEPVPPQPPPPSNVEPVPPQPPPPSNVEPVPPQPPPPTPEPEPVHPEKTTPQKPPPVVVPPDKGHGPDHVDRYAPGSRLVKNWSGIELDGSISLRLRGLTVGALMGAEYPWFGAGVGSTKDKDRFDDYVQKSFALAKGPDASRLVRTLIPDYDIPSSNADKGVFNIFFNAWAETGGMGLLGLLGVLGVVIAGSVATIWRTRRSKEPEAIRYFFALFLALLLYHQTIYLWVHPWFWTMIALTVASGMSASGKRRTLDDAL